MENTTPLSYKYILKEITVIILLGLFIPIAGSSRGLLEFGTRILTHFTMIIILLIWLAYKAVHRQRLPRTALDLPIVFVLLATLASTIFSVDARLSLEGLLLVPIFALHFYLIVDLLRNGWPSTLFVRALIIAMGIACMLGVQEATAWYLRWYEIGGSTHLIPPATFRIARSIGGANTLAAYINLVLPLVVVETIRTQQRLVRVLLAGWLIVALFVEFLTSSRGGWLGLASGMIVTATMVIIGFRQQGKLAAISVWIKKHKPLMALAICGIALAAIPASFLGYRLLSHPSHLGADAARIRYWTGAVTVFQEHPLTGAGYFTYAPQYLRFASIPPEPPTTKAHNSVLSVAAELGLLGLAAAATLGAAFIIALRAVWSRSSGGGQLLIAGCMGSLGGALIHSLVDDFLQLPIFILITCLLVALALEANGRSERASRFARGPMPRGTPALGIVVPFIVLGGVLLWSNAPYYYLLRGAELASQAKWEQAIYWISKAAESDPRFGFYHFQLGFAYGNLAASQPDPYLTQAISEYDRGFSFERNYALNHANLAGLYWQGGQRDEALQAVQAAIELAPRASLYHIQLGSYYEEMGLHEEAEREYDTALALDNALAENTFWKRTVLREDFIHRWKKHHTQLWVSEATRKWQDYSNRAWEAHYEGRHEEALYNFQVSILLGNHTEGHMALGQLAYQEGDIERAVREYEIAVRTVLEPDSYGPFVYRRIGFYQSILPQLPELGFTTTLAQAYTELGTLYEEMGELDLAQRAYEIVVEHDPTFEPALERLESLQHIGERTGVVM
jgi:tetratricopeptide (TPR) repeat protein